MALPMKTTAEDLDKLTAYLRTQVGWVEIDNIKAAIPPKHVHGLKLEAMKFLGLLERDGANVKLTDPGRQYANGDEAVRESVMRERLRSVPLYYSTLQWLHFTAGADTVSKTELANYWHDHHAGELGGAQGDAITDATIFFMRMVGISGLARFVAAGAGRDTELRIVGDALEEFVTGAPPPPAPEPQAPQQQQQQQQTQLPTVNTVGAGLHVNVEIHVAADAKPATVEEIFKNLRKYLIDQQPEATDGS